MPASPRRPDLNFDRVADEYDRTRGGVERATGSAGDVAGHVLPGDVLEIGVGTAIVAHALLTTAPQIRRLAGIDISARMLAQARPRLPGRLVRGSAEQLPFADGRFDSVVGVHVLHLVPDLARTLTEVTRVLRPGGRLVALHGDPQQERDDDLSVATRGLRALRAVRDDSPGQVRTAAASAGLRCVVQHPASPRRSQHTPAELADLLVGRSWSALWSLDDEQFAATVQPMVDALRALPDQHRPRPQESRMTVSAFERR